MSETAFHAAPNHDALDYALRVASFHVEMLQRRGVRLDGAEILELGPGAEFCAALVLASHGARVTLADRFLAPWRDDYHPDFYRTFLARYDGPKAAIAAVVGQGGYDGVLRLLPQPAEALEGVADASLDVVLSNAVLEHVQDFSQAVHELARISRPGSIQAHQIDWRDHWDFARPLDHLLMPADAFDAERAQTGCQRGTQLRPPEMAEAFAADFWLDEIEPNCFAEPAYLDEIMQRLPDRFARFPRPSLRILGARLWLSRKPPPRRVPFWQRLSRR
jgi:SAM-dependent methyltransferase